jgi:hypothetical protein
VLYFTAIDPLHGRELWRYTPDAPPPPAPAVVGRHVFYNESPLDGGTAAPDVRDDAALAADKVALLPGAAPSFANVTSYFRGINGVMVDVANLPAGASLTAADFSFRAGRDPSAFSDGPAAVQVDVRRGAGAGHSDRVTITWPSYVVQTPREGTAVANGWLEVTVKATPNTGLAAPDVFSFGNLIGDTGDSATSPRVNALDLGAVKKALNAVVTPASPLDFNRDGRINALDLGIVKKFLNYTLPMPPAPAPAAVPTAAPEAEAAAQVSPHALISEGDAGPTRRPADELLG